MLQKVKNELFRALDNHIAEHGSGTWEEGDISIGWGDYGVCDWHTNLVHRAIKDARTLKELTPQ